MKTFVISVYNDEAMYKYWIGLNKLGVNFTKARVFNGNCWGTRFEIDKPTNKILQKELRELLYSGMFV